MNKLNASEPLKRVVREIWKRKAFLLVSLLLLYPVWVWPFRRNLDRFFSKKLSPGMSPQEEYLVLGWNAYVDLFIHLLHPDIAEAYVDAEVNYRLAGRPDLARRVVAIGGILLVWGAFSKFYAIFMFPLLLVGPYLPERYRMSLSLLALVILSAFFICVYLLDKLG